MKLKRLLLKGFSYLTLAGAAATSFAFFVDGGYDWEIFRVSMGMAAGGIITRLWYLKEHKKYLELELIRFAADNYGKVTIPEVAVHFDVTTTKARKMLDKMADANILQLEIGENGAMLYSLAEFPLMGSKENLSLRL